MRSRGACAKENFAENCGRKKEAASSRFDLNYEGHEEHEEDAEQSMATVI